MKIDSSIDFNLLKSEKAINSLSDRNMLALNDNTPSLIITSYDEIVGDFGKELEQEIGLIMAEYSFMNEANMSADELMRLKKMQLHRGASAKLPTSTSAIILAQDTIASNFTVTDSPSSNSLVELTTDRVNTTTATSFTSNSSSPPHYLPKSASVAARRHSQLIQTMRSASACDVRRKELYNRCNERVVSFVNKEWGDCVNTANSNNNNLIDGNQRFYESIMDHDDEQHNQVCELAI